jgi:hypothetical protein
MLKGASGIIQGLVQGGADLACLVLCVGTNDMQLGPRAFSRELSRLILEAKRLLPNSRLLYSIPLLRRDLSVEFQRDVHMAAVTTCKQLKVSVVNAVGSFSDRDMYDDVHPRNSSKWKLVREIDATLSKNYPLVTLDA